MSHALKAATAASLAALALVSPEKVAPWRPPVTAPAAAPSVGARIDSILERPPLHRAHWGVRVVDAATGRVVYARAPQRYFVPASTLKLVVAAAAAHHLGEGYRFRTTLYATGPVQDGVLQGDVVLYGRGDPTLSGRYGASRTAVLEALADSLRARGVRRVAGAVVGDDSHWDAERIRGEWEAYDTRWWYAAPVGALGFNDNAVDLRVSPGPSDGAPPRVFAEPASRAYVLDVRARTVRAGGARTLDFERVPGTDTIRAYGALPLGTPARTESFAVADPARWTATVFHEVLLSRGISVDSPRVRTVSDPAASPSRSARPLVEHLSPPLPRIVGPVLLNSQNWFAEQLVKTLGREVRGEGSWEAGLAVERDFLTRVAGLDPAAFVLRDASGLSASNLVTPEAMVGLLLHVRRDPRQGPVRDALPVSGRKGSLAGRLTDLPGRVRAKTGRIGNVDSLAGFVTTDDGRELAFFIAANASGQPASRMRAAIDDVVRVLARGGS